MNGKQHPLPRDPSINGSYVVGEHGVDHLMPNEAIRMAERLKSKRSQSDKTETLVVDLSNHTFDINGLEIIGSIHFQMEVKSERHS